MEEKRYPAEKSAEIQKLLDTATLLVGLPPETLDKVTSHAVTRTHPANRAILLENDWGGSVYFILDGWVKIRTYDRSGKEVTLNIVGKGEIVGEMAALDKSTRSSDAITLTTDTVPSIAPQHCVNLLKSEPLAGIRLSQLMAKRLRQVNRRLRLREADSLSRVADTLLFLAEGQGEKSGQGAIIPNLPHRELSGISGLARETVTRSLTKLQKKGLIQRRQEYLCIPDLAALEKVIT
ncbi:MAG: Crp/Fnr family transcriptional regulator [Microcystis sp. M53600_WE12]|nr:Crp/Fnr family transcriptional regulator [Microcystis sp. M53600_WE12]